MTPTRSVPGGCIIALFGLGALLYAGMAFFAAWKIVTQEIHLEKLTFLLVSGVVAALLGLVLTIKGWKSASTNHDS